MPHPARKSASEPVVSRVDGHGQPIAPLRDAREASTFHRDQNQEYVCLVRQWLDAQLRECLHVGYYGILTVEMTIRNGVIESVSPCQKPTIKL